MKLHDKKTFLDKLKDEENLFRLETMGGDNLPKSYAMIDEYGNNIAKAEKKRQEAGEELLEKARHGAKFRYFVMMTQISIDLISKYSDIPKFFKWGVYPTEEGVIYWIKNLKGETFKKAIKPIGNAHIDLIGGVYTCIRELENTAIREKRKLKVSVIYDEKDKKTPGGIILPYAKNR